MSWPMVKLGDILSIIRGVTFKPNDQVEPLSEGSTIVMRTKNVQRSGLDISDLIAIPDSFIKRDEQYLRSEDMLISSANSWELVGKISFIDKLPAKSTAGGFISIIRAKKEKVIPKYLYYWLTLEHTQVKIRNCGQKTTNISNLNLERFKELFIPLPSLNNQRRIVAILDKAANIRQKREQAIKLSDDFLRATFLEMFGDPVKNPKGWQRMKFSEVGTLDRGKSKHRPRNAPELLGGIHPLIQTGDVANSGGYITEYFSTYSDIGLAQSKMWKKGTLCITIAANIAKTGILTFDACFPDSVVGFQPNQHVEVEFIQHWLGFLQKQLEETAPEVAQKNINLAILRDLDVIIPDKALQMKFKGVVKKVRELKEKYHNFPNIQPVLSSFHLS
ncbi:restriction endonuclease subunit S [Escherichia coli]